jgi:hypothetical protein
MPGLIQTIRTLFGYADSRLGSLMARARKWTAFASLVALLFIPPGFAATVQEDLANESRVSGLAIAWMEGRKLMVRRLDNDNRHLEPVPGMEYFYDIEPASQYILGSIKQSPRNSFDALPSLPQLALFRLGIGQTTVLDRPRGPGLAVLSPHAERLAILTGEGRNHVLLQYGDLSWTRVHEVYSREINKDPEHPDDVWDNFGWSPDSRRLIYSRDHAVYVFDTGTAASTLFAQGSDPAWSPDGEFIAYVSPRHQLILADLLRHSNSVVSGGMDVMGYPRWSPDSKFVLYTRWDHRKAMTSPFAYYFFNDATDIMALRVADRQSAVVFDPGNGTDTRHIYWIETRRAR